MPSTPRFNRRLGLVAGAAAFVALGAMGLGQFGSPAAHANSGPATPPATPVSVAQVVSQDVSAWNEFSGRLEAVERVDVRARVSGAVQALHFREGSLVKAGDLLVSIDPAPYQAEVARVEAQVSAAQARVSYTQSELARAKALLEERAVARRDFDERDNAAREAAANLRAAQAALQTAQLNLGYTQVRAPVAGRVGKIEVTTGNLVAAGAGAPVLTTLVSVSPIYASFDADEKVVRDALASLPGANGPAGGERRGMERIPVEMLAGSDKAVTGRLQLVDNQVDAKSGTLRVRAVFDNKDGSLIPGQFAKLRMGQASREAALLVNERAVGTDQDKRYVIVVGAGNQAEWRPVTLGADVNGLRVVTSGLKAGERVVVGGVQRVRPGSVLAPKDVAMDAKPELAAQQSSAKNS
ncbi:efflux RND transporter periplasmic adaptor subunit [Roseateles saccharophilus]|uniref:Multidrug efflux system membrane fusion protein n=1 Tax=Roseateles saccharophilus TaxID=304 RepID=A0A4R3V536_ROSSA|nr:efflux RND transporter periplasmic adaptor subunit [Roseateles saccharophilus]MDG0831893.1 efflux RND transporter periplasmic adaptor subunit [Roseateles saccharophilus]TCU97444.1 multidrug efflux system membrane fusion protein [Roseateles saccharophilus]